MSVKQRASIPELVIGISQAVVVLLFLLGVAHSAKAETKIYSWDFIKRSSNQSMQSAGGLCYSLSSLNFSLPCNPAMTALERDSRLRGELLWGQQVSYFDQIQKLLNRELSSDEASKVLLNKDSAAFYGSVNLMYLQETFSMSVEPSKWIYYSRFRNQVLPHVSLFAVEEKNVNIQWGSFVEGPWSWGFRFRGVDRKIIESQFYISELLSSQGSQLIDPMYQSGVYFEPGLIYEFYEANWKPILSLTISEVGYLTRQTKVYSSQPKFDFGASIKPETTHGVLEIGLHRSYQKLEDSLWSPWTFGASFLVGRTQSYISVSESEYGGGVQFSLSHITTGIHLSRKNMASGAEDEKYENQWLLQIGAEI